MVSENISEGTRVRVIVNDALQQAGRVGTVTRTYGDPSFRAAEVGFDGGGTGLFWHYQLEEVMGEQG